MAECGFNHVLSRVAAQRQQGTSGRDRRWLRARRPWRCLGGYREVLRASLRTQRKTACPLCRGPEPINLAIPDAPRVALVLAPVKHAVRRFAVAFGHA